MGFFHFSSKKVSEPEFFRDFRAQAKKEAEHLPKRDMIYGLGIFSKTKNEKIVFEKAPVKYECTGGRVLGWDDAMADEEAIGLLKKYFKPENVPVLKNKYFAESLAQFTDGTVVIVEKDGTVELSSMIQKSGADFVFIVAKAGVSAKVFETVSGGAEFFGRTFFAVAEEGAHLEAVSLQNVSADTVFSQNKFSYVERGAKVSWHEIHTGGAFVKADTEDFLAGAGAESFVNVVSLCGTQHFDFYNASHHVASHTVSKISSRGIAGNGAKIVYRGLLDIPKNIEGAVGKEEGRFILTAPDAEVDAIPSLEARSAEGNFSHAVSIAHLRDEDFFFPASRGISPYRAQAMLLSGFLLKHSPKSYKKEIEEAVSKKLSSKIFLLD